MNLFLRKMIAFSRRRRLDRELAEEMETHRALLEQEHGVTGRQTARQLMGNITLAREESRDMWTFQKLEWIFQDARHALRGLRRSPAFTAIAIASLALGIGANTAIFSFVNAILLKRLPVPEPERLVTFTENYHGERSGTVWRMRTVDELAKRATAFDGIFGWFAKPVSFSTGETAQWVMGELVTGPYFRTLEVKPAIGRLLNDDDVRDANANPVCVLSYGLWQREFAGDPGVLGRSVFLNGHAYRVLGVTARGFYGAKLQRRFDIAIPATRIGDFMPAFGAATGVDWTRSLSWLSPMARLKPGITRTEAQHQTELLFRQIENENNPSGSSPNQAELLLEDGSQGFNSMRSDFGRPVLVLMGVVALVLLVACANLANLLLARAQARGAEFAVRLSIGASRARLVRQLLVESLLLAAGGGIAGVVLSFWVDRTLVAFMNTGRSSASALHVAPDARVLTFSILLSFATAILFGLVPAWQATRPDLLPGLKQESVARGAASRVLLRRSLVVIQIALSLVIVFGAGLLTRTLRTMTTADLGFQPDRVIALSVDPAANGHSSAEVSMILDEILNRARALPGVQAASLAASTPNGSMEISLSIDVPGYTPKAARDDIVTFNFVSPQYFETLGQSLLRGRDFTERDNRNSPRVAIVNEKFVRHYFGGRDPLGRKFRQGGGEVEIAGVVTDARDHGVRQGSADTVYVPEKQGQTSGLTLLVRTVDDPQRVIPSLLGIVQSIDRRMPVFSVHTLDMDVEAGLTTERILGYLSTLFAALATLLAGIGLYGVLAYSIVRRTREIGIRFAVGAQRRNVASLFARESLILVLVGLIVGAPVALVSAYALRSLLFGVTATDPLTLLISVVVLALAALLATSIPLWRAARVNPVIALRWE
jgi:predicted permease